MLSIDAILLEFIILLIPIAFYLVFFQILDISNFKYSTVFTNSNDSLTNGIYLILIVTFFSRILFFFMHKTVNFVNKLNKKNNEPGSLSFGMLIFKSFYF